MQNLFTAGLPDMRGEDLIKRATKGVSGRLPYDPFEYCIISAGSAIAWAYCIELTLLVFYTFRRRTGLYFWSLLISSWGCTFHALGFVLKFLAATPPASYLPFIEVGWCAMVSGQAFVLYSRLHLVVRNQRTLNLVLAMIIINGFCLHTPTIIFTVGSNSENGNFWAPMYNTMERIQLAIFCVQEVVISTIYIMATVRLLGSIYHSKTRTVMLQLILVNSICLGMDVILIGLEYSNNYVGETSVKPMIYAIKLKLEFAVLNQLMSLTRAGFTEEHHWRPGVEQHDSHELRNRSIGTNNDPEAGHDQRKAGGWTTAKVVRGSFSKPQPDEIFRTQQVSVVAEPKGSNGTDAMSAASTAVTSGDQPSVIQKPAKSLMGTAFVATPGRDRRSRPDADNMAARDHSPTESQKEIIRSSVDSEKNGTRWIEGNSH